MAAVSPHIALPGSLADSISRRIEARLRQGIVAHGVEEHLPLGLEQGGITPWARRELIAMLSEVNSAMSIARTIRPAEEAARLMLHLVSLRERLETVLLCLDPVSSAPAS